MSNRRRGPCLVALAGMRGSTADAAHVLTVRNAHNSGSERDLTADVGRAPTLHQKIDSAGRADRKVARGAGAGRIP